MALTGAPYQKQVTPSQLILPLYPEVPNPLTPRAVVDCLAKRTLTPRDHAVLRDFGRALARATYNPYRSDKIHRRGSAHFQDHYSFAKLESAVRAADYSLVEKIVRSNPELLAVKPSSLVEDSIFHLAFKQLSCPKSQPGEEQANSLAILKLLIDGIDSGIVEIGSHWDRVLNDCLEAASKGLNIELVESLAPKILKYRINPDSDSPYHHALGVLRADYGRHKEAIFDPEDKVSVQAYVDLLKFLIFEKRIAIGDYAGVGDRREHLIRVEKDALKARLRAEDHHLIDEIYQKRLELDAQGGS